MRVHDRTGSERALIGPCTAMPKNGRTAICSLASAISAETATEHVERQTAQNFQVGNSELPLGYFQDRNMLREPRANIDASP